MCHSDFNLLFLVLFQNIFKRVQKKVWLNRSKQSYVPHCKKYLHKILCNINFCVKVQKISSKSYWGFSELIALKKFKFQTKILAGIEYLLDIFCIFAQKFTLHKILCKYFLQCIHGFRFISANSFLSSSRLLAPFSRPVFGKPDKAVVFPYICTIWLIV